MTKYEGLVELNKELRAQDVSLRDDIVKDIFAEAENIASSVVEETVAKRGYKEKLDYLITSTFWGYPIMILLLALVLWITIAGANVPSAMLARGFTALEAYLSEAFITVGAPEWLHGIVVLGMFRTAGWVISVMLPPMAIFFPLFTLLEDLGYLPRVAFNLDRFFKRAGAHGKQSLTMCMGFGCNAAGIISTRIIDSPRERLIAMITNNFVPCNGRFPTLIAIATIFIGGAVSSTYSSLVAALVITGLIVFGVLVTLVVSKWLTKTMLKGVPSSFTLELPPFRKPQIGHVIYTSIIDRTVFVLGRAVIIAIPAGILTWILANVMIGDISILNHVAGFIDPFAIMIGLDGFILMAFILGLPANEIVIPILIMSYMASGSMMELDSLTEMQDLFMNNGWTVLTGINVMLFSLLHFPCGTTLYTIKKESGSMKWTLVSFLIPTILAILVCFVTAQLYNLLQILI